MKNALFLLLLFLVFSCNQNNQNGYKETSDHKLMTDSVAVLAKIAMETHCYLCHSPTAAEVEGRIAPPMIALKAKYLKHYISQESFTSAVVKFVENPTSEHAIMVDAVKKHGIMPKQDFPKNSLQQIANYMYQYQIEEPVWFAKQWEAGARQKWLQTGRKLEVLKTEETYADIGLRYALGTKKILGKNLMGAIQKKGTLEALDFCNMQAMPLTDSMSTHYNARIKRVSDKNRNPNNRANTEELTYISQFKKQTSEKQEIKPLVVEKENKVHVYYPIETNTMCLQCHGKPQAIQPKVAKQILKLYPKDLAIGYSESEVRGMWSIVFDKN